MIPANLVLLVWCKASYVLNRHYTGDNKACCSYRQLSAAGKSWSLSSALSEYLSFILDFIRSLIYGWIYQRSLVICNWPAAFSAYQRESQGEKFVRNSLNFRVLDATSFTCLVCSKLFYAWENYMTRNTFCFSFLNRRKNARFTLHKNLILAFILRTMTLFIHYYGNMGDKSYNKVIFSWNTVSQFDVRLCRIALWN